LGLPKKQSGETFLPWITVVIPAYNEEKTIGDTIDSINAQDYPLKKIIVVDDCSTDSTSAIAMSKGVMVLKTPKNTGKKASAQRYGFDHVDTPIAIVVDADTILEKDALELVIQPLSDKNALSACGYVVPQKMDTFWERMRTVEYFYSLGIYKTAQENMGCPMVSSGCFTAFRMDALQKLGGFPENNIAEDMAITWMGHMNGYHIYYVKDAICYPKDPENFQQYKQQIMRWYRGMFQCVHDFKLSVFKKPLLGILIVYYLAFGIVSLPGTAIFWIIYSALTFNVYNILLYLLIIELIIGFVTIMWNGYKHNRLKIAFLYYPTIYVANIINWFAVIASLLQEVVFKNRLSLWEKGH
jgi:cellulose synthase/poly-beta-1,6-N-acetylglucosamine synthase-like glycosyltransferase